MKIIHTSDWHIGKIVNDFSMLEDQAYFLRQLIDYLKQQKADALIVAGDIYDRSIPPAEAVSLVNDTLVEIIGGLHIPVILIAGNHDSPQRLSFAHTLLEQSGLYICGEVRRPPVKISIQDQYGPVNFYLLPYFQLHDIKRLFPEENPATINEAFALLKQEIEQNFQENERNVLVSHGFFSAQDEQLVFSIGPDLSAGGSELISSDLFYRFDYTALGHIHRAQTIGTDNAIYSGSPLKYSIDESTHQKTVTCVVMEKKGKIKITQDKIPCLRDLRIVSGTFEQLLRRNRPENGNLNDYVFAQLEESHPIIDAISKLRAVFPNIMGLMYAKANPGGPQAEFQAQHIKAKAPMELLEEFFTEVSGESLSEEQKKLSEEILNELSQKRNEVD